MTILGALEALAPVAWIAARPWSWAAMSALHLLGISLLVGPVILVDLHLLGLRAATGIAPVLGLLLRAARLGFGLTVGSGLLLFAMRAGEYAGNGAFLAKMALILAAALNAWLVGGRATRGASGPARTAGALSLILWLAVLAAGRAIAFA